MNPQPLLKSFIGIEMYEDDYNKVKGLLPTPSYTDMLQGYNYYKIILIYAIEGYITSSNQYRWISNIKLGLEAFLCVKFDYVSEFDVQRAIEITSTLYQIEELSKAFKAPLITYPKIMYPSSKKEIYKCLCRYGKRLIHQKCFTKEIMIATALLMNNILEDKYSNKDLHKKALGAYIFIDENREGFSVRLDKRELQEAHSKGGAMRKAQIVKQTKDKIAKCLKSSKFYKPNGKVNLTKIAKTIGVTRQTVAKYV